MKARKRKHSELERISKAISFLKYLTTIRMHTKLYSPGKLFHHKQHEEDLAREKNEERGYPERWVSTGKRRADDSTEVH